MASSQAGLELLSNGNGTISSGSLSLNAPEAPCLLSEHPANVFGLGDNTLSCCLTFTRGYGAVLLLATLGAFFFQEFLDCTVTDAAAPSSPTFTSPTIDD